jgi:hypothetical protein
MKSPSVWKLKELVQYCNTGSCLSSSDGKTWFPARPNGFHSIGSRIAASWKVFTGKADAVVWDAGQ